MPLFVAEKRTLLEPLDYKDGRQFEINAPERATERETGTTWKSWNTQLLYQSSIDWALQMTRADCYFLQLSKLLHAKKKLQQVIFTELKWSLEQIQKWLIQVAKKATNLTALIADQNHK